MKGTICYHKPAKRFYISWYQDSKTYKIYRYTDGQYLYDKRLAQKLLSVMQGDVDRGTFKIDRYMKGVTDTIQYLRDWIEDVGPTLAPATIADYQNSIKNHLNPFFKKHPIYLHEIRYDILIKLLNSIRRTGKGKLNVMSCLHACLDHAWRSERIQAMPPFPKRGQYNIVEPEIQWLSEQDQMEVINSIPIEHHPIFLWLKYHLRRISEAMALHKIDYDKAHDVFIIRRSISDRKLIERTKTSQIHIVPCHPDFKPVIDQLLKTFTGSPFLFSCKTSRSEGNRYTDRILAKIWHKALKDTGHSIGKYAGTKHSSCCQYLNEKGLSLSELQVLTDHKRPDSVLKYGKTEVSRKRELMQGKVIEFKKVVNK